MSDGGGSPGEQTQSENASEDPAFGWEPMPFRPELDHPDVYAYRLGYHMHRRGHAKGAKGEGPPERKPFVRGPVREASPNPIRALATTTVARRRRGAVGDLLSPGTLLGRWLAKRDTTTRLRHRDAAGTLGSAAAVARATDHLGHLLTACAAGSIATFLTHPIDTILVNRQVGSTARLGLAGLFRGVLPATAGGFVFYGTMQFSFGWFGAWGLGTAAAGACSGLTEALFRGPVESYKNVRQTGAVLASSSMGRFAARGTAAMACREIPGNALYFTAFAYALERQSFGSDTFAGNALAGSVAGATWSLFLHPVDALRVQFVTGRPLEITFRGIGPSITRGTLAATIYFAALGDLRRRYL